MADNLELMLDAYLLELDKMDKKSCLMLYYDVKSDTVKMYTNSSFDVAFEDENHICLDYVVLETNKKLRKRTDKQKQIIRENVINKINLLKLLTDNKEEIMKKFEEFLCHKI